jgi:hypothetical protein
MEEETSSIKKTARTAGLWYLIVAIISPFGLIYVPAKLIVPGNATVTVNNIMASEFLFRIGIVSFLLSQIASIFLVLALYRLFKRVDQKRALLMVALVLVSVPIGFLNMLNPLVVMFLLSGADFLSAFGTNQLNALVMVFLALQDYGTVLAEIFWGLWLFPFGLLVIKSGFFPKILGILLVVACFCYVAYSITCILFPNYNIMLLTVPAAVAEFSMILWLLIKGAKEKGPQAV